VIVVASERLISGNQARSNAAQQWLPRRSLSRLKLGLKALGRSVRDRRGTIALSVAVVLLLQPMFVAILMAGRSHADLNAIRSAILSAFEHGVLADSQAPISWMDEGGHQFTECVSHNVSLDSQEDILKSALLPMHHFHMISPCIELHWLVDGDRASETIDYSRYWHGYRIYQWFMLGSLSLRQVRLVNALTILVAAAIFFVGFRAALGTIPAAVFFAVFLALTDLWRIWVITTHALSMALILAGVGIFALVHRTTKDADIAIVLAAVFGSLFNFVDFLINPPLMPMLLSFVVIAIERTVIGTLSARPNGKPPERQLGVLTAASWFGGYGLTWVAKWALAIGLSDRPAETGAVILKQIAFRIDGLEQGSRMLLLPLIPTIEMVGTALISVGAVVVVIIAILILAHARENRSDFEKCRFYSLISPTSISFVWFELLNNHTQLHPHFVYRSASGAIAIVLTAMVIANKTPISPEWVAVRAGTLAATLSSTWRQRFPSFGVWRSTPRSPVGRRFRGHAGTDHLEARHHHEIRRTAS
jgi:hypothetical protein